MSEEPIEVSADDPYATSRQAEARHDGVQCEVSRR
jgi:hypothetical protein